MNEKSLVTRKKRVRIVLRHLKKLFPKAEATLTYHTPWELLIAVILSAQTTDVQVNKVTEQLFKKYRSLRAYVCAKPKEFEQDISSIGLYRAKAKNILAAAKVIQKDYDGHLPRTMKEMVALPGVGRKTANVVLGIVYGVTEGIAVDTHVRRLAKKFGLTENTDSKKIEQDLMQILPKNEWHDFTFRMIEYGRKYSPARGKGDDPIGKALEKMVY